MSVVLTATGVSAGYGPRRVLHDVDLPDLSAGSLTAVLGPNAAGKSTLMKVLAGLIPHAGDIRLGAEPLSRLGPAARTRRIGYLPQTLPQGSGLLTYEAVLAACRTAGVAADDGRIEGVFRLLGLDDAALRSVTELSGGKRQLVGLAQVLVRDPCLLLLDEPTSALDLRWQIEVLQAVRDRARRTGAAAAISIHDINLAMRFCDRVVVLSHGRVISAGAPGEAVTPEVLRIGWEIEARLERCSKGHPIVVADRAVRDEKIVAMRAKTGADGAEARKRDDRAEP